MNWSPEVWNDLTAVAVALLTCAAFILALLRGWLVLGKHADQLMSAKDREIAAKDRQIERLVMRADKDNSTIHMLSQSVSKSALSDDINTRLLRAVREYAEGDR